MSGGTTRNRAGRGSEGNTVRDRSEQMLLKIFEVFIILLLCIDNIDYFDFVLLVIWGGCGLVWINYKCQWMFEY